MINERYAKQLQADQVEFGALAKEIRAISTSVGECRDELAKVVAGNPRLAKSAHQSQIILAKMDATLSDIARRLDRLAGQPVPLPFLPAFKKEPV